MNKQTITLVIAAIVAVAASFWAGGEFVRRKGLVPAERPDTVFIERWVRDTIREAGSVVVETRLVYLQVHDTTAVHDTTTITDSVLVEVPITEKVYIGENYRATVRGYRADLVDIWIKQRETIVTVPYRKHWTWTIGPQAGFGITPEGWRPYAGFGATFGYSF